MFLKESIDFYKKQFKKNNVSYDFFCFSNIAPDLKSHFDIGDFFIERHDYTAFDLFAKEIGYPLPNDICDYINAYWQPGVFGYYNTNECIILFPVVRYVNDTLDSILLQKNGLINSAKQWKEVFGGDINKYLPIGYLGYSGINVLYEVSSGKIFLEDLNNEGVPEEKSISESLRELIINLKIPDTKTKE